MVNCYEFISKFLQKIFFNPSTRMKRASEDKEMLKIIKNRQSARRSVEKKKKELDFLKKENYYLKLQNKYLTERIHQLENSHLHSKSYDFVQCFLPFVPKVDNFYMDMCSRM